MSRRVLTPWLLVASLLVGLWTAAAHEAEHAGPAAHVEICVVCAFASGVGDALPSAGFVLFLLALASVLFCRHVAAPRRAHCAQFRARGPPIFLA